MSGSGAVRVDASNGSQLEAWNGGQGDFWAEHAQRLDEGVAAYREHFLAAAAIEPHHVVLDIGCGTGQTSRDAARLATAGSVLGVDLSARMLGLAGELTWLASLSNVYFEQADAQLHPFQERGFDLAISRHGAMFFGDPPAAFANLARALRPGGRLVLLTWQPVAENEWLSTFRAILSAGREQPAALAKPASLSDPELVRGLLEPAGFTGVRLHDLRERMYFGRDTEDAFRFVSAQFGWLLDGLDETARDGALAELRADLAAHQDEHGVRYRSAAWLIEAVRA